MITAFKKVLGIISLFRKAFSSHTKKMILMISFGFVGGFLGGIGIGAIIPLFYIITNQAGAGTDSISNLISKIFGFLHLPISLLSVIALMAFLFIAKAVFLYIANYISTKIFVAYELETRERLFHKTLHTDWPYLMNQKTGYLNDILMGDVGGIAGALNSMSAAVLTGTSLITYAIIALNISIPITLATLGLGALMFFLFKPVFYQIRKLSGNTSETIKKLSHHLNQHITGAKTIKSMSLEDEVYLKGVANFHELKDMRLKWSRYGILLNTFVEPVSLGLVVAIFLTSYQSPDFNIATFVAIIYLVQKMFSFIQSIQGKFNAINEALPLINILVSYEKDVDKNREFPSGHKKFIFNNALEFKDVSFGYAENPNIIDSLNLSIKNGEMVGLIGPSGAGKTTIVDLILRLFRPRNGELLIDGANIDEIDKKSWHEKIGYVSQDIFLLNDTIENNIRFYSNSLSEKDVVEASKSANIYDFIETLPDKFKTIVGERGVQLSGGQRQRVVLARILARKPCILILDEATSALDNESEHKIQEAIKNLKGKLTILIIAHRLSTVMHSDNILVLKDNSIVEKGSPQELLQDSESYFYKNYNLDKE